MSALTASIVATVLAGQDWPPPPPPVPTQRVDQAVAHFDRGSAVGSASVVQMVNWYVEDRRPDQEYAYVRGHADSRGSDSYNLGLSRRRALFIADAAVRAGVDPDHLQIMSCGERLPRRPTDEDADETLNRYGHMEFIAEPLQRAWRGCELETYSAAKARLNR